MNKKINCKCELAELMRQVIPVPGTAYRKMILVALERGESVSVHEHRGHSALYYPADSSPVIVHPRAGMIIYLPPGTEHSVPPVGPPRVSVAMIVEPLKTSPGSLGETRVSKNRG